MTKDVIEAILERRSIRKFSNQEIPMATIGRILDAAQHAPSAGNCQPWSFYVVLNDEIKTSIGDISNQSFISQAPVAIVVCAIPSMSSAYYSQIGESLYCIQDTAAAIQNILLAANGYGLGTCWVGEMDEKKLHELLELPDLERPVAIIPIGYPEEEGEMPAYRPSDEVIHIIN